MIKLTAIYPMRKEETILSVRQTFLINADRKFIVKECMGQETNYGAKSHVKRHGIDMYVTETIDEILDLLKNAIEV